MDGTIKIGIYSMVYNMYKYVKYGFNWIIHGKRVLLNTLWNILYKKKLLIIVWWKYEGGNNWGDALNPILIKEMTGKEPIAHNELINLRKDYVYSVIGSILGAFPIDNLIVWGSGFIDSSGKLERKPKKICAVRGPLTRELLLKQGVNCPEIYGDPALLYPLIYNPCKNIKYKLGIIPHYVDQNNPLLSIFKENSDILLIDILSGINEVVDDICKCEFIASSSLHGIIAADAYGVPSTWIEFSDKVVGNGFKFYDYFLSVGRKNEKPLLLNEKTSLQDIYSKFYDYKINIDLTLLLEACPFLDNIQKNKFKQRIVIKSEDKTSLKYKKR